MVPSFDFSNALPDAFDLCSAISNIASCARASAFMRSLHVGNRLVLRVDVARMTRNIRPVDVALDRPSLLDLAMRYGCRWRPGRCLRILLEIEARLRTHTAALSLVRAVSSLRLPLPTGLRLLTHVLV